VPGRMSLAILPAHNAVNFASQRDSGLGFGALDFPGIRHPGFRATVFWECKVRDKPNIVGLNLKAAEALLASLAEKNSAGGRPGTHPGRSASAGRSASPSTRRRPWRRVLHSRASPTCGDHAKLDTTTCPAAPPDRPPARNLRSR
jgi:hypothetical protein